MRRNALGYLTSILFSSLFAACANVSHPTGGDKDVIPPKLVSITPEDSQLNTRVSRLELKFDEFVQVNNPSTEVQVSPLLPFQPTVEALNKRVIIKIPDTLLQENTTYRISFGNAIGDIHENNVFKNYSYIFSTGSYFDSLKLSGRVIDAATGRNDTGAFVLLYDAKKSDSIVVREKPIYVTKTDGAGSFNFEGLPDKEFKIFALHDANGNLMYDDEKELIAFNDKIVKPKDSITDKISLYIFSESDSVANAQNQSSERRKPLAAGKREEPQEEKNDKDEGFTYTVSIDTSDVKRRTRDIITPLEIVFNKPVKTINENRVNLSYDNAGTLIESEIELTQDTLNENKLLLQTDWKENTLYTLRLLKNFAIDSSDVEAMPSKHTFRTKSEADYAKLHVHLPTKYLGTKYVFVLLRDGTVFYQKPVTDTNIHFYKLQPGAYSMRIIEDVNENGKWDRGNLFEKIQPEKVIPNETGVDLKAGWENTVDFAETSSVGRRSGVSSPNRRVAPR